jgi:hypothetical protein
VRERRAQRIHRVARRQRVAELRDELPRGAARVAESDRDAFGLAAGREHASRGLLERFGRGQLLDVEAGDHEPASHDG